MSYELEIHFDGSAPGLEGHSLSVGAFGASLNSLLSALRRIATQMVSSAVEGETPRTGRFADPARNLDIEIREIRGNSLELRSVITFQDPQGIQQPLPFWADLPERAGIQLLDSIERESRGQLANSAVRKYLSSLPAGIRKQEYNLHSNGTPIKNVVIGDVQLTALPVELPYLRLEQGSIVGVGFDPGRSEIRLKPESGSVSSTGATQDDVERALQMRHEKVRILTVHTTKGTRLISLKRASEPQSELDPARMKRQIFDRWGNVLRALSK